MHPASNSNQSGLHIKGGSRVFYTVTRSNSKIPKFSVLHLLQTLTMAATQSNTDEVISQSLMKIQSTNYQVDPIVSSVTPQNQERRKRSGVDDVMYSITTV